MRARVAQKLALVNLPGIEDDAAGRSLGRHEEARGPGAGASRTEPEVILWDEPTTGPRPDLDAGIIDELIVSMKEQLGCTSIVVTHDMDSAFRVSDRMAMLANRRIVAGRHGGRNESIDQPRRRAFFDARDLPRDCNGSS